MNYIKIQTDMLKMLDKELKKNHIFAGVLKEGSIAVTLNGYALYKVPLDKFYIDINKIPGNQLNADAMFDFDTEVATKSDELKKVNGLTIVKIAQSSENYAWVDEKLLTYFDKKCTFAISNNNPHRSSIKVYENDVCVGIVLPFIIKD